MPLVVAKSLAPLSARVTACHLLPYVLAPLHITICHPHQATPWGSTPHHRGGLSHTDTQNLGTTTIPQVKRAMDKILLRRQRGVARSKGVDRIRQQAGQGRGGTPETI